jgi:hypothetical protein
LVHALCRCLEGDVVCVRASLPCERRRSRSRMMWGREWGDVASGSWFGWAWEGPEGVGAPGENGGREWAS